MPAIDAGPMCACSLWERGFFLELQFILYIDRVAVVLLNQRVRIGELLGSGCHWS